jgi:DNA-binding LacI/PurR family transcriptional regulator
VEQRSARPRIADVAREAGVSKTAVSFAFNSPDRLAPGTAERIRLVAEQLGYRPHPVARMLSQRETLTIGLLTPQALSVIFSNPFFGAFSEGVAVAAEASGYALYFISPLHGSLIDALERATVDGVVAIGLADDHPEVAEISGAGVPIVVVDSSTLPGHGSIEIDDEGGARAAAEHLVELGHREVIVIGVEPPAPAPAAVPSGVMARRLAGYRAAFAAVGAGIPDDRVHVGPASIAGGMTALGMALDAGWPFTAVLAMSDAMAIGAMRMLHDRGMAVPTDVSIVGFDDIDLAQHVDPALTTVHQPIRRKGEEAVDLLLATIRAGRADATEHRRLEARLVVRDSTGPARRGVPAGGAERATPEARA